MLSLLAWILLALSTGALAFWLVVAIRLHLMLRPRPTIRRGLDLPPPADGWPKVSIIVPAHDEEHDIDACATSLRAQTYEALEILFVLDRCTDGTLDVLRRHADADARIELIENDSCPPDWAGKCNAARLGADRATGDWLLFTDADTEFDPGLVRAAVAVAHREGLGLLSLLSTLRCRRAFERIAQPVATMQLMRMYPMGRLDGRGGGRPFANGQFMLFDRVWYERLGGHAAVKDDLLEDIAFARRLHAQGGTGGVLLADGLLTCSMYESLEAFRRGWSRIYIEACKRKPRRLRKNGLRTIASGTVMPVIQLATVAVGMALGAGSQPGLGIGMVATAGIGGLAQLLTLHRIYRLGGAPASAALLYPIGSWIVGRVMLDGARDLVRRRPISWGGREYVLEPRF